MKPFGVLIALSLLAFLGCGEPAPKPMQVQGPVEQVKSALEYVGNTGTIDSGIVAIREQLEILKQTDAAKADALLKDLADLETTKDAGQIKSKAKAMAAKL